MTTGHQRTRMYPEKALVGQVSAPRYKLVVGTLLGLL